MTMNERPSPQGDGWRPIRFLAYLFGAAALFEAIVLLGQRIPGDALFSEDGVLEWVQITLLVAAAGAFTTAGRRQKEGHWLFVFAMLAMVAALRELDRVFDRQLPVPWEAAVGLVLLAAGIYCWRRRGDLKRQWPAIAQEPIFAMLAAAAIALAFSRLLGQAPLWKAVMGPDDYRRIVKNAMEEGTELLAYVLLLVASIEACLCRPRGIS